MNRKAQSILDRLGSHGGAVLVSALVVVAGTWGFVELLDAVKAGVTQGFDEWAVKAMDRWHGPEHRMLEEIGRDITALGGIPVLTLSVLAVVGFLLMVRNYGAMWLVIVSTTGGLLLAGAIKRLVDRPRPDLGTQLSNIYTTSFPSGHSMMAAVIYLTLGSLLASLLHRKRLKIYCLSVAFVATLLVGISRVYMGVHWPTDVLAGWTGGLVWALLCWTVAHQLRRRGAIAAADREE